MLDVLVAKFINKEDKNALFYCEANRKKKMEDC